MARVPYALVACFSTGAPWSEQLPGTDFHDFMRRSFGSTVENGSPSQPQDLEFSCAFPTRSGSNSLIKGASACHLPAGVERSRFVLAVRGLWMQPNALGIIRSPSVGRSGTKFWLAIRAKAEVVIPADLGNDRNQPLRRVPSELSACLPPELLRNIKSATHGSVAIAEQALIRSQHIKKRKSSKQELINDLTSLTQVVEQLGVISEVPRERPSTA